jgi:hypothetical protein
MARDSGCAASSPHRPKTFPTWIATVGAKSALPFAYTPGAITVAKWVKGSYATAMPILDEIELNANIANGKIGAISVDTSIFDRYQCNLKYPSLVKLAQFRDTHITVLISEIVAEEMKLHLSREALKSQRDLRSAVTAHARRWQIAIRPEALNETFHFGETSADFADEQATAYFRYIDAQIVPAVRSANVAQAVIERYFNVQSPFETSEKKKAEFPDAFALLSLEEWASDTGKLVLCVSADAGWQRFAETSPHLVCVSELDPVFDLFNAAGGQFAKHVLRLLRAGKAPDALSTIWKAFAYRLADNDFDVSVGDSPADFEYEQVGAQLQDLDWSDDSPNVLEEDSGSVTFTVGVKALIEFSVDFHFHVRDGGDRDDVSLGSELYSTERWFQFDLAITVSREADEEVEVLEATASRRGMTAIFSRIDPFRLEYDG